MEFNFFFLLTTLFLLGICFGSFLNVVIDRFATSRSILKGRSYCEFCKKTLKVRDLVPLFSFLLLRGKCRFCNKKISARLFLVELLTGIITVFVFTQYLTLGLPILILLYAMTLIFLAILFIDLEYGIIPDKLTIALTVLSLVYVFALNSNLVNHLAAGISSLLFFVGLFFITRGRGMGMGDVKIAFALGLLLGYPLIIYGLYIAFLTGAVVSIILVLWKKKSFKKGTVPFGPFLAASTLFTLFFGEKLILPLVSLLF